MSLIIEKNKNLENFNFYKIKVEAKYFFEIKKEKDFLEIFYWIKKNKIKKFFILGEGANIIFKNKKYDGLVIKISNNFLKWKNDEIIEIGAGKNWDKFLYSLQKKGLKIKNKKMFEIQSLASIPSSVGAATFGNIGAFGSEIKKYISRVKIFDIKKQEIFILTNEEMNFSYRNSFVKENKNKFIIISTTFNFSKKFSKEVEKKYKNKEYFSLEEFAKKNDLGKISAEEIRKNIKNLRRKVYPSVKRFPNVGSTFKNTEIAEKDLKNILEKNPEIPNWKMENGKIKIPTAFIFDKVLGLNGKVFGNIEIHKTRPLFFMNRGGATGKEFFDLCQKIKKDVKKEWGVEIEEEVVFAE